MKSIITWHLPVKTASEANSSEHWTKKSKRHRLQKGWVKAAYHRDKPPLEMSICVVMTRIAPRKLDEHDNLPMSMKYLADALAECKNPGLAIGRADDDKSIKWEYKQEKGKPREYAVRIEIYNRDENGTD